VGHNKVTHKRGVELGLGLGCAPLCFFVLSAS